MMDLKSTDKVLVHACCAPCSGAILEWLVGQGVRPTVFFSNANIYPLAEYELRRGELLRYAAQLGQKASGSNQEAACSTQEASGSNQEAACSTQEASDGGQGPGSQEPRGLAVIDDVYDHEAWPALPAVLPLPPGAGGPLCARARLQRPHHHTGLFALERPRAGGCRRFLCLQPLPRPALVGSELAERRPAGAALSHHPRTKLLQPDLVRLRIQPPR